MHAPLVLFFSIIACYRLALINGGVMCYSAVSEPLLLLECTISRKKKKSSALQLLPFTES